MSCSDVQPRVLRMPLTLLVLLMLGQASSAWMADMYVCDTQDSVFHFKLGQPFELCCKLKESECRSTSNSSTLLVVPSKAVPEEDAPRFTHTRLSDCETRLRVDNSTFDDTGDYRCLKDKKLFYLATVNIVDQPHIPSITFVSSTPKKNLTVKFDRGPLEPNIQDFYEVILQEPDRTDVTMCSNSSEICRKGERVCECRYNETGHDLMYTIPLDKDVTIIVRVKRGPLLSVVVETRQVYNLMLHIVPQSVRNLQVQNIMDNEAIIKFCMRAETAYVAPVMKVHRAFIHHHLVVSRMQGVPEQMMVTLQASGQRPCMAVWLRNLTAFTNYTVVVWSSGGGGAGYKNKVTFVTGKTIPFRPPVLHNFGFSRVSKSARGYNAPALLIFWEPLPHAAKGGDQVSYYLEVSSNSSYFITRNTTFAYKLVTQDLPEDPLSVRIWSQNEIGRSEKYAEMVVPAVSAHPLPSFSVEFSRTGARVLVDGRNLRANQTLLIHRCQGHRSETGMDICEVYPQTTSYTLSDSQRIIAEYNIALEEMRETKVVNETREIKYYHLSRLDKPLIKPRSATAMVKLLVGDTTPDMQFSFDPQDRIEKNIDYYDDKSPRDYNDYVDDSYEGTYEYNSYEDSARKRRSILDILGRDNREKRSVTADDDPAIGNAQDLSTLTAPPDVQEVTRVPRGERSLEVYPRIMVSVLMDGQWSGMIPTNCYYDEALTDIKLKMNYSEAQGKIQVQMIQECDESPRQFQADSYEIYTLEDNPLEDFDACSKSTDKPRQEDNKIFSHSAVWLPSSAKFVCVRVHNRMSTTIKDVVKQIERPSGAGTDNSVAIIAGVLVSMILIIIMVALCLWCLKRRQRASMIGQGALLKFPSENQKNMKAMGLTKSPEPPQRNGTKGSGSTSSDSGVGTIYGGGLALAAQRGKSATPSSSQSQSLVELSKAGRSQETTRCPVRSCGEIEGFVNLPCVVTAESEFKDPCPNCQGDETSQSGYPGQRKKRKAGKTCQCQGQGQGASEQSKGGNSNSANSDKASRESFRADSVGLHCEPKSDRDAIGNDQNKAIEACGLVFQPPGERSDQEEEEEDTSREGYGSTQQGFSSSSSSNSSLSSAPSTASRSEGSSGNDKSDTFVSSGGHLKTISSSSSSRDTRVIDVINHSSSGVSEGSSVSANSGSSHCRDKPLASEETNTMSSKTCDNWGLQENGSQPGMSDSGPRKGAVCGQNDGGQVLSSDDDSLDDSRLLRHRALSSCESELDDSDKLLTV